MNSLYQSFAIRSIDESLQSLQTSRHGLSTDNARARQSLVGLNIVNSNNKNAFTIFIRQFKSSFIYLLAAAIAVSFSLGEFIDAIIIIFFVLINALLGFFQEFKSEKAIQYLEQFWQETAEVLRDGKPLATSVSHIVPGDILLLKTGDVIPADVRFIESDRLVVNESALTGELGEIPKYSTSTSIPPSNYSKAHCIGFSGTTIVSGLGQGVVFAIGKKSVIGGIQRLVTETRRASAFEQDIKGMSRFVLRLVLLTLLVVFIVNLLLKGTSSINELLLFSIALAVSVIPEALPLVTTVSLSAGALRLAKQKVVVRRLSAIEDLGSITTLCSDKTGTITQNILSVKSLVGQDPHKLLALALAASDYRGGQGGAADSFDLALWHAATHESKEEAKCVLILASIPFDPRRRINSTLAQMDDQTLLIIRGAPESVFARCHLPTSVLRHEQERIHLAGANGMRVLAVAAKPWKKKKYTPADEQNLLYLGHITFHDPLKPDTLKTITKAKELGVSVKILTGDAPEVAGFIGRSIGLIEMGETVLGGDEFMSLPHAEQKRIAKEHSVFARLSPEQKFFIISLLKEDGTVGFLGEGFNDAPALKIADVALVVQGASELSRESADVVLLQKSLFTIVSGIEEGRKIFSNTVKYIKSTLTSNFGNFYAIAVISLIIPFLPMLPVQILLVNLLSDFPMIAVATDSVSTNELKKPKRYDVKEIALIATILGLASTFFDFIFFGYFYKKGAQTLQTMWFIGSILTELALIYSIRTHLPFWKGAKPNATMVALSLIAAAITLTLPFLAWGQNVFHFIQPRVEYLTFTLLFVIVYFVVSELVKLWYYRFVKKEL